jgi:hypothetical protein
MEFAVCCFKLSVSLQVQHLDLQDVFITIINGLPDWKKGIIRKLGFRVLLDYSCSSNISEIFSWLVQHTDLDSTTVTFEDGFSFTLSTKVAQIILGLPCGSKSVQTKISQEASDVIHNTSHSTNVTVELLFSLLTNNDDIDEVSFSRLLPLLSLFLLMGRVL